MREQTKLKRKENANRGITLIALVITIIVLLILVAVSIATLTAKSIHKKCQDIYSMSMETINLSSDSLSYEAYDDDMDSFHNSFNASSKVWFYVDSSFWGNQLMLH